MAHVTDDKAGPRYGDEGTPGHHLGARAAQLRADGQLSIVCPAADNSEVRGVGIFSVDAAGAGVIVYEVYPCRGFPGDSLPA